jgi:hypothetical protein
VAPLPGWIVAACLALAVVLCWVEGAQAAAPDPVPGTYWANDDLSDGTACEAPAATMPDYGGPWTEYPCLYYPPTPAPACPDPVIADDQEGDDPIVVQLRALRREQAQACAKLNAELETVVSQTFPLTPNLESLDQHVVDVTRFNGGDPILAVKEQATPEPDGGDTTAQDVRLVGGDEAQLQTGMLKASVVGLGVVVGVLFAVLIAPLFRRVWG